MDQNENTAMSKAADFFRPMTECTVKENYDFSIGIYENDSATEPCLSFDMSGSKKLNLMRTLLTVGAAVAAVSLVCSLCSCMRRR